MRRLITFGDSFTYGEGLPDCIMPKKDKKIPPPSKFAWGEILANKIKREHLNISKGGTGNKQIATNILNTSFRSDDIVVILWTYWHRHCVLRENEKSLRILPSSVYNFVGTSYSDIQATKLYYDYFFEPYDAFIQDIKEINLVDKHLKDLGINPFHYALDSIPYVGEKERGFLKSKTFMYELPAWNKVDIVNVTFSDVDRCEDGHPGVESHKQMAEYFYRKFPTNI